MRARHRRRLMAQINVVPYIDVSLVLLIIFMITAPLLTRGVKIDLPQAAAQPLSQKELEKHQPVVLTVDKDGRFYLNVADDPNKPIPASQVIPMVEIVLHHTPDTPVLVRGDDQASYAEVVQGMTLLQSAGATHIGLVTKTPAHPLVSKPKQ
jgi:biopolymer transport protein TolR